MELFQRKNRNMIEGININELDEILINNDSDKKPIIDTVILDTILLSNNKKIKCIKNYYSNLNNESPKKARSSNTCSAIQKFYNVSCRPYECVRCHRIMLSMRKNNLVKSK